MNFAKKNIFLFLVFAIGTAKAQVPGYLGMKNSFGYEPNIGVAFYGCNSNFNGSSLFIYTSGNTPGHGGYKGNVPFDHLKPVAFNVTHTFVYDRIVKRNASFNASFSFYKSGCYLDSLNQGTYNPITGGYDNSVYKGGPTKISGFAVSVSYRRYRNYLAPLGLYAGYFFGFGSSSAMVHNSSTDSTVFVNVRTVTPKFGYVYGRQNVFFDKLVVDRGFTFDLFGLMFGALSKRRTTENLNGGMGDSKINFQRQVKTRMYYRDLVTFYIGAKYMF